MYKGCITSLVLLWARIAFQRSVGAKKQVLTWLVCCSTDHSVCQSSCLAAQKGHIESPHHLPKLNQIMESSKSRNIHEAAWWCPLVEVTRYILALDLFGPVLNHLAWQSSSLATIKRHTISPRFWPNLNQMTDYFLAWPMTYPRTSQSLHWTIELIPCIFYRASLRVLQTDYSSLEELL